jgi:hypothetical protein
MTVNASTGFRALILGPRAFESIFDGGCIEIRSGAQPETANMAPTGTLLGRISLNGLTWTPGSSVNGLKFRRNAQRITNSVIDGPWVLKGIANGIAGWMRLRAVNDDGSLSSSAPRIDGEVGNTTDEGNFQLRLPTLTISNTSAIPITSWWFAFPPLD